MGEMSETPDRLQVKHDEDTNDEYFTASEDPISDVKSRPRPKRECKKKFDNLAGFVDSPLSSPDITLNDEAPKKKVKGKKSVAGKQRMEIGVDDECNEPAKSHVKPPLEEVPKNSKKMVVAPSIPDEVTKVET